MSDLFTVISGVALVLAVFVGVIPLIAAGNVLGFFRFGMQSLVKVSGVLPSRKRVWGTVYDARTKKPLPFANVRLMGRDRRVLEQRIADSSGRYAFLTTGATLQEADRQVLIEADYTGYAFPSHEEVTASDSFLYDNLYHGQLVSVDEAALINYDIPLDPVGDVGRRPVGVHDAPSIGAGLAAAAMADVVLWIGFIAVPLAFVMQPSPFTFGFVCLFAGTASLRLFGIAERPFGTVSEKGSDKAVPFALLTLKDESGTRVGQAVSDEKGRYVIQTHRGTFMLAVHTPANVQPPRIASYRISTRKGWLAKRLEL